MKTKNNFYVYLHIQKDNGKPFYVGKGCGNRATQKKSRTEFWNNIVNRHGRDVIFLEKDLTEQEAFEKEVYWIKRIGRRDLGLGTLVNLSDGGEGSTGHKWTEEQRQQASIDRKGRMPWNTGKECPQLKGEKNGMFGKTGEQNPFFKKTHTKESRKIMSEKNIGRKPSEETRKIMSENRTRGKHIGAKKVIDIVTKKVYDCLKDAADLNNINYSTLRNWLNPKNTSPNKSNLRWL